MYGRVRPDYLLALTSLILGLGLTLAVLVLLGVVLADNLIVGNEADVGGGVSLY